MKRRKVQCEVISLDKISEDKKNPDVEGKMYCHFHRIKR